MAVDLGDLIDPLKRRTSPPGTNLFPNAVDDEWVGHLSDAFWDAKLSGFPMTPWTEADGTVVPAVSGGDDIPRDFQQLIVIVAAHRIVRTAFMNIRTSFRSKAGPVEYETEQSAALLRDILKDIEREMDLLLTRMSDLGNTKAYYIDALLARDESMLYGDTYFEGSFYGRYPPGYVGSYSGDGFGRRG